MAVFSVETLDPADAASVAGPWRDLCRRALEANAFAEPGFLIAAARHLAPRGVEFLLVWEQASARRLVGLMAITPPRFGVAAIWRSEQAGLAAFALDCDRAGEAFAAAAQWLREKRPRIAGLFIPMLAADGATASRLQGFAASQDSSFVRLNPRQRAILPAAQGESGRWEQAIAGKRLKEWRRLRRRLEERGPLVFRSAQSVDELAAASEAFLALEPRSWKGRSGAPLTADPARAAFARSMLSALSVEGKLRIDLLELADAPIAIGVILSSGGRAFYWKTGYDEAFAKFSPGVLLALDLSRKQENDPKIAATDSCAVEGHPMIERLWSERIALVDCFIALRPGHDWRASVWLAKHVQTRRLKEFAKRALFPILGRKRS